MTEPLFVYFISFSYCTFCVHSLEGMRSFRYEQILKNDHQLIIDSFYCCGCLLQRRIVLHKKCVYLNRPQLLHNEKPGLTFASFQSVA